MEKNKTAASASTTAPDAVSLMAPAIALNELLTLKTPPTLTSDGSTYATPAVYTAFGGRVLVAFFRGTISVANADCFSPALKQMLTGEARQVVLSFKEVTKLSRTAVGLLVDFAAGVLGRGLDLYLYEPSPVIMQRLGKLNVDNFFLVLGSEDELFNILPIEL